MAESSRLPGCRSWPIDKGSHGLELRSHQTLYLADGSVVLGVVRARNARNITIRGRGILAATFLPGDPIPAAAAQCMMCLCGSNHAIDIEDSSDVQIEGITVVHSTSWNVTAVQSPTLTSATGTNCKALHSHTGASKSPRTWLQFRILAATNTGSARRDPRRCRERHQGHWLAVLE
jgi:hypothetical protein